MNSTIIEVLKFVKESDVKFIRLSFCDIFGVHKNIAIMADELQAAFENGVSFDAYAIRGFRDITQSDLLLFPDPATLRVLPWRPGPGRVVRFYCDIKNPDGSAFLNDSRFLLKRVIEQSEKTGYVCKVGAECEFYLFKTGEDGEPTDKTLDRGGYLDISPFDKAENVRREICLTLEEMGIKPETSHHERGPGQNEISFKFSDALDCADNFQTFKSVVKEISNRNGLFASFMPKPIADAAGSGLHINLSLAQNGHNIFKHAKEGHSDIAESFIAGILAKTPELTLFLNPLINSYDRFGKFEAPKYVSWSHQNRSQLIRIPATSGEKTRMELRSPDPALNPYLAFALIIAAGFNGIENKTALPPAVNADLYAADKNVPKNLIQLPDSLEKAIAIAQKSDFIKKVIGDELLSKYIVLKKTEIADFSSFGDKEKFYKQKYFNFI
ncbi:MAG: glutamine synthetase family protein [Endomicrobia bacterium]|nr:glutamine synthetase family protein [Endomicrobiia bacterium]